MQTQPPRIEGDELALPEPNVGAITFRLLAGPAGHLVRAVKAVKEGSRIKAFGQFDPERMPAARSVKLAVALTRRKVVLWPTAWLALTRPGCAARLAAAGTR